MDFAPANAIAALRRVSKTQNIMYDASSASEADMRKEECNAGIERAIFPSNGFQDR